MTRILLTGITGYLGGQVLHTLTENQHKDVHIIGLVRDKAKGDQVKKFYPEIEIIVGDLDDEKLMRQEAEGSDIVLHLGSTSHAPSAKAISQGLQDRHHNIKKIGYWVQISGATCYASEEIAKSRFGHASDVIYDDIEDQNKILSILRNNPKRVVENTVLSQSPTSVRTALIVGPLIYGVGQGPVNKRSIQAPEIARATLTLGHAFKLEEGENIWSNIHVQDIAGLISLLVTAAREDKGGIWNDAGVYHVENGSMTLKALNVAIADEAHRQGLISQDASSQTETINATTADSLSGHASVLWGTNARTTATKARQWLGWKPSGESVKDTIPDLVRKEAEAFGKAQ